MDAKITLPESDLPRSWYNILADAPTPPQPPLHPGTHEPVGPDDRALVHPRRRRQQAVRLAHDQRAGVEIAVAEHPKVEDDPRHGRADDAVADRQVQLLQRHQRGQPDEIFVRGAAMVSRDAPERPELRPVPDRKDGVGVAGVDAKQHVSPRRTRPPRAAPGARRTCRPRGRAARSARGPPWSGAAR